VNTDWAKRMYVIGLTGNIASGKTIAARRLEALGARVICADEAARRVVCPGSEGLRRVGEAFGDGVIRLDGSLDRAALGRVVFGDAFERKRLEAILHPLIIEDILQTLGTWEKEAPGAIAVVDAALLFETGLDEYAGEVWLVEAQDDIRLRRIMDRDGLSENEARARMESQAPSAGKRPFADRILVNNGSDSELLAQVDALWALTAARISGEE